MIAIISAPQPTTAPISNFKEFPQRSVPVLSIVKEVRMRSVFQL